MLSLSRQIDLRVNRLPRAGFSVSLAVNIVVGSLYKTKTIPLPMDCLDT